MESEKTSNSSSAPAIFIIIVVLILALAALKGFFENLELETELSRTKQELNEANQKLAKKPDLPVSVSIRQAMAGPGLVAQFTNQSTRFLSVIATFHNPTTNQEMSIRLDLAPNLKQEIGHLEGWTLSSGDLITVQHNDYATSKIEIQ